MAFLISRRGRWILALAAAAALVVGLQSSQASAGGGATASRAKTVSIADFTFKPGKLVVNTGTKVSFSNNDGITHTATKAGSFDTGHIKPGHLVSIKFSHAGTFAYHCSIHPFMHGKIVVK